MKTIASTLLLFTCFIALTGFNTNDKGSLIISLSNINKTGKINIAVYRECKNFPDDKFIVASQQVLCSGKSCTYNFNDLPYGEYAVAIYQDVNGNSKLDTGTFGIPDEPFAFSNNFKPRFGGPSYGKCKFSFNSEKQTLEIQMINSLFGGD